MSTSRHKECSISNDSGCHASIDWNASTDRSTRSVIIDLIAAHVKFVYRVIDVVGIYTKG